MTTAERDGAAREPSEVEVRELAASVAVADCGGLVGAIEACELLGIPSSSRGNLYALAGLPEPFGEVRAGRVWLRSSMERFAETRRRRAG